MGCLRSVFAAKKQGKPIWEVRTTYWKLREACMRNDAMGSWHVWEMMSWDLDMYEKQCYGILACMRNDAMGSWHVSLAWGRQEGKEDQGITFVQVRFCGYGSMYKQWGGSVFYIFGLEYRYSSVVSVPEFNTGIRVSVLLDEYRYPFEVM
ncbi:hypothetical protein V6N11_024708 [Hibiscus sabdariffa]|uniref:Uncharacterized protein n=1 Tax=Hibiscus sabdariffa TaxID=183260 RepID=A0ABR2QN58_9ROSI